MDSIFVHPFGYNNGRKILKGKESSKGEFYRENGELLFDEETRAMIKSDDYHSHMARLAGIISEEIKKRGKVTFRDGKRVLDIVPSVHYTAGGIETDEYGRAIGCGELYAIGECSADGSRNGGRLPGYAFTAAIVHGKLLAEKFSE